MDAATVGGLAADELEGEQGPRGPEGPAGETGEVGPAGEDGRDGQDGSDGATGPQGPQGEQGIPGPAGPEGPAGVDGQDGTQGPPGDSVQPTSATFIYTVNRTVRATVTGTAVTGTATSGGACNPANVDFFTTGGNIARASFNSSGNLTSTNFDSRTLSQEQDLSMEVRCFGSAGVQDTPVNVNVELTFTIDYAPTPFS